MFTAPGSLLTASMLRDIEGGMPVEGDHILGDLLRRAAKPDEHSVCASPTSASKPTRLDGCGARPPPSRNASAACDWCIHEHFVNL